MQLEIAKLVSAKLSERIISSGVLENPDDVLMGKIFYIIDIPLPQIAGEPVEKTIIDVLKHEYFSTEKRLPIYQFEDSVKQVNAALSELAESSNNEWIGHIHATLALWAGDEIFITYAGRAVAYLVRKENLISIIDQTSPDRRVLVHKTFANMISGQLSANDIIVLGNYEISRHFSPQFLSQAISETPSQTVNRMIQAVRRLNLKYVTAIIAKTTEEKVLEESEDLNVSRIDDGQLILDMGEPVPINLAKNNSNKNSGNTIQKYRVALSDHAHNFLKKLKELIKIKNVVSEKKPDIYFDDSEKAAPANEIAPPIHQRSAALKVNNNLNRASKHSKRLANLWWHKIQHAPRNAILGMIIIIVLTVAYTSYVRIKNHQNSTSISDEQLNSKITEITILFQSAQAASKDQPEVSRSSLITAKQLLQSIENSTKNNEAINTLRNQTNDLLNQINRASIIATDQKERVASGTDHFIVVGQYLFSSQQNKNSLYRQILGRNEEPQSVVQLPDKSTLITMVYREKEHQITYATSNGKIYNYQTDGKSTNTELKSPGGNAWPEIQSVTWYQNNMYILEKSTGIIWKYLSSDGITFSSKQKYIIDEYLVKNGALSITADGYVYILYQDGNLAKMSKGKNQTIANINLPQPDSTLINPSSIYTDDVATSIFLTEQNRLIEISKDGQYVHQYILPNSTIKASFMIPKTKKAWVLFDNFVVDVQL